jgi:hypothetical protein
MKISLTVEESTAIERLINAVNIADEHNREDASINVYDAETILSLVNSLQDYISELLRERDVFIEDAKTTSDHLNDCQEENENLTRWLNAVHKLSSKDYSTIQRQLGYIEGLVSNADTVIYDGVFGALEVIDKIIDETVLCDSIVAQDVQIRMFDDKPVDDVQAMQAHIDCLREDNTRLQRECDDWHLTAQLNAERIIELDAEVERLSAESTTLRNTKVPDSLGIKIRLGNMELYASSMEEWIEFCNKQSMDLLQSVKDRIHDKLFDAEMHGMYEPVVTAEMFDEVVAEIMEDYIGEENNI